MKSVDFCVRGVDGDYAGRLIRNQHTTPEISNMIWSPIYILVNEQSETIRNLIWRQIKDDLK